MRFRAHLTAYDTIGDVAVVLQVYEDGVPSRVERDPVLTTNVRIQGQGVSDAAEWVRDVLIAALEAT